MIHYWNIIVIYYHDGVFFPRIVIIFSWSTGTPYPLYLFQYAARSGKTIEVIDYMERHNDKINSCYQFSKQLENAILV